MSTKGYRRMLGRTKEGRRHCGATNLIVNMDRRKWHPHRISPPGGHMSQRLLEGKVSTRSEEQPEVPGDPQHPFTWAAEGLQE
ncbi:hypothetical protein QJS10_CPA08g01646 [Acorus calamus]|uniref:Ribosomal protein L2 n=1 Tax=Acorus calamus TaxID=4465 RepID=A0AAV9ECJ7_ACOCL|nr:hypothetical protein QJS10_CPA08g01646 [Acorus calamus]